MVKLIYFRSGFALLALAALIALAAFVNLRPAMTLRTTADEDSRLAVVAVPGYHVRLFTKATAAQKILNPDSVVVDGSHVFIDYQNVTAKDGTDGKSSTVVEYNMEGEILKRWDIPGHSDGMRMNPADHVLWTTSNEDGNPAFATIDPKTGVVTKYKSPAAPHGGGYDDLQFLNGEAFIAASNPTLDSKGINVFPAVDEITLNPDLSITLTPILMGNATAVDSTTGKTVTLNLTDPDSLSTDTKGNLVLVSQADSELITITDPGNSKQIVTSLPEGDQLDDTVYPSGAGRLLVVDAGGSTYWISKDTKFTAGSIYTEAPNDSGVTNFVGTVDPKTGFITPFAVGFTKATGMVFVPNPIDD